jgi:hypothetical protein
VAGGSIAAGIITLITVYFMVFPYLSVPSANYPQVSAKVLSCNGNPEVCTISLQNNGNADTTTTANCELKFGNVSHTGSATIAEIKAAGVPVEVNCTASSGTTSPGSDVTGSITLTLGNPVLFQGIAS